MLNGFWTVTFSAPTDLGAEVVTIANGKAMGGDTSFTYIGPFNAFSGRSSQRRIAHQPPQ